MSSFPVHLRERCSIEAFQAWLDLKKPGFKVVGIRAEAPCRITLEVVSIDELQGSTKGIDLHELG